MAMNAYLVLNTGSSSIKCQLFDATTLTAIWHAQLSGIGSSAPRWHVRGTETADEQLAAPLTAEAALNFAMQRLRLMTASHGLIAIGHRVVHGGNRFAQPVIINSDVLTQLRDLVSLAPLHQPFNLAGIHACQKQWSALPQIACFDTSFHQTQPTVARLFALPQEFAARGIVRYGFHGLSYQHIRNRLQTLLPEAQRQRVIVAHLGNGASLCALKNDISIDTTMGFTALDGLVMGTRCGALDAGVVLHLMQHERLSADAISTLLYKKSGLLGVSGVSGDMRELLTNAAPAAQLAVDLFVYRCVKEIGALAAVLGGLDTLVFTAGIGEHASAVRARIGDALQWLGLNIDTDANLAAGDLTNNAGERCVSSAESAPQAWVIPTNEELEIAKACQILTSA